MRRMIFVSLAAVALAGCMDSTEPAVTGPVSLGVSKKLAPLSDIYLADGRFQANVFYDNITGPDGLAVLTNSRLLVVKEFGDVFGGAESGVLLAKKGSVFSFQDAFSTIGPPFRNPDDITITADQTVYVADGQAQTVFRIAKEGGAPEAFVTTASTRGSFNPFGLAVAPATFDGPNVDPGDLIVSDNAYGTDERAVWAVNPETGAARIIAEGSVFGDGPINAAFTSDGTCFIIENAYTGIVRIATLDADGTVTPFFSDFGGRSELTIHPITDELFFTLADGEIYRMPKTGGTPQLFAGNIGSNQDITFNAAGTILYVSARARRQVIQISAVRNVWEDPQFSAASGPVIESVTGGAHYTSRRAGTPWRTFSLNARKYADGSVEGMFQVNNHGGSWFKGVITCFSIDGNRAWLGGIATSSSAVLEPGDERRVLWVEDNGQGTNAEPDRLRGIPRLAPSGFGSLEEYCEAQPDTPERFISDLEAGNIKVKQ